AAIAPTRALLAVDTIAPIGALSASAEPGDVCKMLLVPQLNAALAVSGNLFLASWLVGLIIELGRDFDAVARAMLRNGLVDRADAGLAGVLEGELLAQHTGQQQAV